MTPRRVVVTGLGVISALGPDCPAFWQALSQGHCGIAPIESVDRGLLRFENGAEVRGFEPGAHFDPAQVALLDPFAQFAVVSAREAVRDAGLDAGYELGDRTAIITGSCVGGQSTQEEGFGFLYREGRSRLPPYTVPRVMANAGASQIALENGITGPAFTVASACSSSNHAIGLAFHMVRHGMAERALAGGSEAPFSFGHLKAWEAIRAVSPDTCRPFSRDRRGMILGEGGAMLVLEPLDAARSRGAAIHAEIVGFGMSSDSHHITQPSPDGAARAMQAALADGDLRPEQIEYINAHGTGTAANDPAEARAIHQLFGPHAKRLAVSATKSLHGHALGAAGALEAVATILALRNGLLPPTANFAEPDPECDLDVVPNTARPAAVVYALSNSFAFGGLNAVLAFRRWEGD